VVAPVPPFHVGYSLGAEALYTARCGRGGNSLVGRFDEDVDFQTHKIWILVDFGGFSWILVDFWNMTVYII